jgi:fatty-acyl-CoA synthase
LALLPNENLQPDERCVAVLCKLTPHCDEIADKFGIAAITQHYWPRSLSSDKRPRQAIKHGAIRRPIALGETTLDKPRARTLPALIDELGQACPDRPAVSFGDKTITFSNFRMQAMACGRALRACGVMPGDRVGLLMGNRIEWLVACFGAQYAGATLVALNTWYTGRELAFVLAHAEVSTLITVDRYAKSDYGDMLDSLQPWKSTLPALQRVVMLGEVSGKGTIGWEDFLANGKQVEVEAIDRVAAQIAPGDLAYLLYTSGSTAHPKGVMLEHEHLLDNTWDIGERLHYGSADTIFLPISLFWGMGCENMLLASWTHKMHIVLQDQFDPAEALKLIDRHGCTAFCGTPNIVHAIFQHPDRGDYNLSSLCKGVAPGSPDATRELIEQYLPLACHCYGLTESYGFATVNDAADPIDKRCFTEGRALPGTELVIVDPATGALLGAGETGEVRLKGHVMRGYYNQSLADTDSLDANGFFKTGDLGQLDDDGYLVFKGRLKEMLKTGGINVSPIEVEEVLRLHPGIREALVIGLPDPVAGEAVAAILILEDGTTLTHEQVRAHCRATLAAYKVPQKTLFTTMDRIPLTSTSKIHRTRLHELFASK